MNEAHEINKRWWNEVTPVHVGSDFYAVDRFLAGENKLGHVERDALGDVSGKRLLHLQCHFGMDTMSWARLGAEVVGVDFSREAIKAARDLAEKSGLAERARFLEADVTEVGKVEGGEFDFVFTSFGTICWLSDLTKWGTTVAANLAKDGLFYFLDSHPTYMMFDEGASTPALAYDYFHDDAPIVEASGQSNYADETYRIQSESRSYQWPLQDIFGALEAQGLTVCEVREYPFGAWRAFPDMEPGQDGYWYRKNATFNLPLLLGFKAHW
jgi:SAM-dependent methyltransferase